jgi:hypothetical protein
MQWIKALDVLESDTVCITNVSMEEKRISESVGRGAVAVEVGV